MKQADLNTATSLTRLPARALALSLCMIFTQAACADSDATAATPAKNAVADVPAASTGSAVPEEKQAPKFSAGMQIPVDGTSLESFEASLADIKTKAKEDEYTSLEGAIKYLMVYDLSAQRNKTKLAANLNGLTGEEIVNQVGWLQSPRSSKAKSKSDQAKAKQESGPAVEPAAGTSEEQ